MSAEKIEKLKKGLTNSQIPETLKDKIREQIKRLEAEIKTDESMSATEIKKEIDKIEEKVDDSIEVVEKKQEEQKEKEEEKIIAKKTTARKPRTTKTVATKPSTAKPSQTRKPKRTAMSLAKEIRKQGESWNDARARASKMMKEDSKDLSKTVETELDKLSKLVKNAKTRGKLAGISGTDIKRDAVRRAKPRGERKVTHSGETSNQYGTFSNKLGRKYYESRDRHSDRLAPNYPKNAPLLARGGATTNERKHVNHNEDYEIRYEKPRPSRKGYKGVRGFSLGGTVVTDLAGNSGSVYGVSDSSAPLNGFTNTYYTNLVGETGAMSSGEMFEHGGALYSAYTDNPLKYLSLMGAKTYGDLNYSTSKNGIDYYIGRKKDKYGDNKAIVVAFITDEDNYMIDKEDAQEMSETAREKGVDKVELYTNYGVELRSTQKPQILGFDKIVKVSGNYEQGGGLPNGVSQPYMITEALGNPAQHFENGGDLFENYEEQPEELSEIVDYYMNKFDDGDYDYQDSQNFLNEVEEVGYTFDYGLDNEPYNLRPIENKMNHGGAMHDYKKMEDNYARGGGIRTKNGREYPIGRNWTNDHKHLNQDEDYEVNYRR